MFEKREDQFSQGLDRFIQDDLFSKNLYAKTTYNSSKKELLKTFSSRLYCWGYLTNAGPENLEDSLLEGKPDKHGLNTSLAWDFLDFQMSPKRIKKFREMAIVSVTCGKNHSALVSNNGSLYMIGANDSGQLGGGADQIQKSFNQPVLLHSLIHQGILVDQVSCGHSHTLMVSKSGQVYSWGYGKFGALGSGTFESRSEPQELQQFSNQFSCSSKIKMIQCGAHHSALINSKGQLYLWGAGEVGQLGLGNRANECSPVLVGDFLEQNESVDMIACGYFHTVVLTTRGRILHSGQSKEQTGEMQITSKFSEIQNIPRDYITNVKAKEYTVALNNMGQLLIWQSPSNLQIVTHNAAVNDFDLCKSFVLFRCSDRFFKWSLKQRALEPILFDSQVVQEFSILSCGHNYILGVKTKKKKRVQKSGKKHMKSTKEISLGKEFGLTKELTAKKEGRAKDGESWAQGSSRRNSGRQSTQVKRISSGNRSKNSSQDLHQFFKNRKNNYNQNGSHSTYKSLVTTEQAKRRQKTAEEIQEHVEYEQSLNDVASQQRLPLYSSSKKLPSARKNGSIGETRRKNSINVQHIPRQGGSHRKEGWDQSTNQTPEREPASFYLAPKSLRISYEETGGHLSVNQQRKILEEKAYGRDNLYQATRMVVANNTKSSGNLRNLTKEDLKLALNDEVERRIQIEREMGDLQSQFASFKKDVGVEQMKQVLADSQQEYQKLYDVCVQECEKGAKLSDQYKREKKVKEERENQIVQMGEEQQMLTNQVKYLEEQLAKEREGGENWELELEKIKKEQVRAIEEIKCDFAEQKQILLEKNFDLEEALVQAREELQSSLGKTSDLNDLLEREREENKKIFGQNMEMQAQLSILDQQLVELEKERQDQRTEIQQITKNTQQYQKDKQNEQEEMASKMEGLEKELALVKEENESLMMKVQNKAKSLVECDQMIKSLKHNEKELKDFVQRLQSQMKTIANEKSQPIMEPVKEPFDYISQIPPQDVSQQNLNEEANQSQQSITSKGLSHQNYCTKQNYPTKKFSSSNDPSSRNSAHQSTSKIKSNLDPKLSRGPQTFKPPGSQAQFSTQQQNKPATKQSPERLQSAIKTSDMSTNRFINDIKQMMGGSASAQSFSSSQGRKPPQRSVPVNEIKKPQTNQSRSQSPLDKTPPRPKSISTNSSSSRTLPLSQSVLQQRNQNLPSRTHQSLGEKYQPLKKTETSFEVHNLSLNSVDQKRQPIEEPQIISTTKENIQGGHSQNPSFGSSLNFSQRIQTQIETNPGQAMGIFDEVCNLSSGSITSSINFSKQLPSVSFSRNHINQLNSASQKSCNQDLQQLEEGYQQKEVSFLDESPEESCEEENQAQEKPLEKQKQHMSFGDCSQMNFLWNKQMEQQEEMKSQAEHMNTNYESYSSTDLPVIAPGQNIENLKEKLDSIRKNKSLLEGKIKEYEMKLGQ